MKAEDIERMWLRYRPVTPWTALSQHAKDAFAALCRACEQHGIERAKASVVEAEVTTHPRYRLTVERSIDWSVLDAEIAKENEG